ncbi:UNVERIFIED_CONTAM: hypothetical protein GTU68_065093 [Idotea baltica]|nr:hypothetical protein [Idotea baltica]
MSVPQVAIVGRPNVGKSSLFNWIARRRLAIVDNFEGVTRDRMTTMIEFEERFFELIDTGGMGIEDPDDLTADVQRQIEMAINCADVILLVVDVQTGLMPLDEMVAERLRGVERPVILVANKADQDHQDIHADEFHRMGRGHLQTVSTTQNRNREDLLRLIVERLPDKSEEDVSEPEMKLAIVGRRNVGKSTFVNTLSEADRMIVSEVPGTTRDSVDVRFEMDGQTFIAMDTPGLRKRKSQRTDIEFYGLHRAQRSIRRADVVLMFFDASETISKVDKQLLGYVMENYKPVILSSKWIKRTGRSDDVGPNTRSNFRRWRMPHRVPTGRQARLKALVNHASMLFKQTRDVCKNCTAQQLIVRRQAHQPPMYQNRRPRIFYATQLATEPQQSFGLPHQNTFATTTTYLLGVMRDTELAKSHQSCIRKRSPKTMQ